MSATADLILPDPVAPSETLAEAVNRLADLSPLEYDTVRESEAKKLGVRVTTLDTEVRNARKQATVTRNDDGDIEPYQQPIEPTQLLDEVVTTIRRFIVAEPETMTAAALWIASTWFIDVAQVAPLAVITAPEKRCGKSQLLTLIGKLSRRPMTASSISPAALFRAIDAWQPTLLIDETDALLKDNEELRGLLNAGHTRDSAYVIRVVGDDFTPTKFSVWGCKALSGIGHVADTLMDRAVILELRRKLHDEQVDRLRYAEPGLFDGLAAKMARFMVDYSGAVRMARPDLPEALNDRAQDNWEPLLAIADVAGGHWPQTARKAALHISGKTDEGATQSTGTELLTDIKAVFERTRRERIKTVDLLSELCADDEAPWSTYNRGKPISGRQLGKRLSTYGISSKSIRNGHDVYKGFELIQFSEVFARYLSTPSENIGYGLQNGDKTHPGAVSGVTDQKRVTVTENSPVTPKASRNAACSDFVTCNRRNQGQQETDQEALDEFSF